MHSTATTFRRFVWPLTITAIVLACAAMPVAPLVRLVNTLGPPIAALHLSAAYTIFAPVSDTLDTLTLFSPADYWSTFALAALVVIAFGVFARRHDSSARRALRFVRSVALLLGATIATVGLILVLPRPMASLTLNDPDLVAVDFHSHTASSHDGRAGFDAERNRAWHASAGFDVAYVTDHETFAGALDGLRGNPGVAGAGTVLLPGLELRNSDQHVLVIGADPVRTVVPGPDFHDARVTPIAAAVPPLLILPMPGNVRRAQMKMSGAIVLAGIEFSDGCPRGLAQTSADAGLLAAVTKTLGVAGVAGSDNHGWGRTAAAWSVLRIKGWRAMSPSQIDDAIRSSILTLGVRSVEVVARRRPGSPASKVGTTLGGVSAFGLMLRTMTWPERVSWISWTWIIWLVGRARAQRRQRGGARGLVVKSRARPDLDAAAMELA